MGTIDISYYNLFVGLLLLAIPFFYLWKFKTGLLKPAVIGTLRMIIQLFFIGIYLKYLFLWNNPWINFLWVIVMIFVAGQTALVRTGLLMGNMLSSNVIALNTYYSGLKREQQLYRYLLGNGATRQEAQAPFIKQAIIKSFSPLIANIAVMGLVALPGTMIGQILGGSSPNVMHTESSWRYQKKLRNDNNRSYISGSCRNIYSTFLHYSGVFGNGLRNAGTY